MEIELTGGQVSADSPQTDGNLIVHKFQFLLREEKPAVGCAPIEAELTVKFSTHPGQIVPTDKLLSCRAVLSMPAVTPIKALRYVELHAHRLIPGRLGSGNKIVKLSKDDSLPLAEPAKKMSEKNVIYEVLLAGAEGYVYLVEGLDFEFID